MPGIPVPEKQLVELRKLVTLLKAQPSMLLMPEFKFFNEFVESRHNEKVENLKKDFEVQKLMIENSYLDLIKDERKKKELKLTACMDRLMYHLGASLNHVKKYVEDEMPVEKEMKETEIEDESFDKVIAPDPPENINIAKAAVASEDVINPERENTGETDSTAKSKKEEEDSVVHTNTKKAACDEVPEVQVEVPKVTKAPRTVKRCNRSSRK